MTARELKNAVVTIIGGVAIILEADLLASPWRASSIGATIAVLCGISFGLGKGDAA